MKGLTTFDGACVVVEDKTESVGGLLCRLDGLGAEVLATPVDVAVPIEDSPE